MLMINSNREGQVCLRYISSFFSFAQSLFLNMSLSLWYLTNRNSCFDVDESFWHNEFHQFRFLLLILLLCPNFVETSNQRDSLVFSWCKRTALNRLECTSWLQAIFIYFWLRIKTKMDLIQNSILAGLLYLLITTILSLPDPFKKKVVL